MDRAQQQLANAAEFGYVICGINGCILKDHHTGGCVFPFMGLPSRSGKSRVETKNVVTPPETHAASADQQAADSVGLAACAAGSVGKAEHAAGSVEQTACAADSESQVTSATDSAIQESCTGSADGLDTSAVPVAKRKAVARLPVEVGDMCWHVVDCGFLRGERNRRILVELHHSDPNLEVRAVNSRSVHTASWSEIEALSEADREALQELSPIGEAEVLQSTRYWLWNPESPMWAPLIAASGGDYKGTR